MLKRLLFVLLFGGLLSACYESQTMLLDPSQARQPLVADSWTENHDGGSDPSTATTTYYRLTPTSDGWYDYASGSASLGAPAPDYSIWSKDHVLLNDLGYRDGATLYAYAAYDDEEGAYVYGILAMWPNGAWRTDRPDCAGEPEMSIAANAGATSGTDVCMFDTNASLMQALRAYSNTPEFWTRLNDTK